MTEQTYLGELEQMVLWAVLRRNGHGYGAVIMEELEERAGRRVSTGALYATLDRLESKGVIESRLADPEPGRGGRRKRLMTVTPEGVAALSRTRQEWMSLWEGMDSILASHDS